MLPKGDDSEHEAYLANATRLAESKLSNAQKDLNSATTDSKVDDQTKTSTELEDRVKEVSLSVISIFQFITY